MYDRIISLDGRGYTIESVANMACTDQVKWSWAINVDNATPVSLTGLRTSVDWSKSEWNTGWDPFSIQKATNGRMDLITEQTTWMRLMYAHTLAPSRELELERALMRLDILKWFRSIKYRSWPVGNILDSYGFRVENRATHKLMTESDWPLGGAPPPYEASRYGWGCRTHLRVWDEGGGYVTIAPGLDCIQAIESVTPTEGTWMAMGPRSIPIMGTSRVYEYSKIGWNPENFKKDNVAVAPMDVPVEGVSNQEKDREQREKQATCLAEQNMKRSELEAARPDRGFSQPDTRLATGLSVAGPIT